VHFAKILILFKVQTDKIVIDYIYDGIEIQTNDCFNEFSTITNSVILFFSHIKRLFFIVNEPLFALCPFSNTDHSFQL
jgi:hypothetical protein